MSPRRRAWRHLPAALALAALAALVLLEPSALARVGGGQGYSGGRGGGFSGGGGGFSGGGSSGGGDLVFWLVWLVLNHPAVGVPLVVVAGAVFLYARAQEAPRPEARPLVRAAAPAAGPSPADRLRARDPNFSEPLFIDFAQLVYARGQELRPRPDPSALRPWFTEEALADLRRGAETLAEVRDVIFGATTLTGVELAPRWSRLHVTFETNITEIGRDGDERQVLRREAWTFRRRADALSPGPDRMRVLACPSCGSTAEPRPDGTCPSCDAVRTGGRLQWEVSRVNVLSVEPLAPPELHLGGGVEPGTRRPTVVDPRLPARMRAFQARHPDHDWRAFEDYVRRVFLKLQEAWSSQRWELARPYETDALFQVHRFWMERYRRLGLVNRLADVEVQRVEVARVDQDAFFESITVRIWARMRDWTERVEDGRVVGGSRTEPRVFSEYWTFIRATGAEAATAEGARDAEHCPSCGAPLDRVSMAGVCGYCDSKITGGEFDWVLSRIEQDEAYRG